MAEKGIYELTDLWDAGGTTFTSIKITITDTAYAAGSRMLDITSVTAGGYIRADVDGNFAISGYMDFAPMAAAAWKEGRLYYDSTRKGLVIYNAEEDISGNLMEEEWVPVFNDTGVQIDDGTPLYVTGTSAGLPTVAPAIADGQRVIGLATHNIGDEERGYATRSGGLSGPDYSAFSNGDTAYLSPVTPGTVINVEPSWPNKVIELGIITDASNPGSINIDIEHHGGPVAVVKSYTFASRSAAAGEYFQGGFYDHPDADANLTNASTTVVHGSVNHPYAAHAFMVFGAATTDGTTVTLTVSGTSITDAGVRTPADSEVLFTGAPAGLTLNDYIETALKFVGAVTYTLTSDGATFTFDFNLGYAKYEDFNNVNATLRGIECVGLCNTSDSDFEVELIHHSITGWTYAATGFHAGNTPIATMNTDHGTEQDIVAGEQFAWKRSNMSEDIQGNDGEGVIVRVTTGTNNSVSYMDTHVAVTIP